MLGSTVGGYRVEGLIASGGMGAVYRATQISVERPVALKVINAKHQRDPEFAERFRREGHAQANLHHPNIVTVIEPGVDGDIVFLAMLLVDGPSLEEALIDGPLSPDRAIDLLRQVASALDFAHEEGIVHRDVKPGNILIGRRDHAFITDFGIARDSVNQKLTRTGQYVGTLDYSSPEQHKALPLTPASDVYSLAAVLFECLTGGPPFVADSEYELMAAHVSQEPPRATSVCPQLPRAIDRVLRRGLAKDPADRFESATALIEAASSALTPAKGKARRTADRPGRQLTAGGSDQPHVAGGLQRRTTAASKRPSTPTRAATVLDRPADGARRLASTRLRGVVAVGALVLLAAGGYVIGSISSDADTALAASATSGGLTVDYPEDWTRDATDQKQYVPGITFERPIHVEGGEGEDLTVGMVDAEGPTLLTSGFRRRLTDTAKPTRSVELNGVDAYEYLDMETKSGERYTLYVAPTDAGVATLACDDAVGIDRCQEIAASFRVKDAKTFDLGPSEGYAERLNEILRTTETDRDEALKDLKKAKKSAEQADAAQRAADAFDAGRGHLNQLDPGPQAQPAEDALVSAFGAVSSGYAQLASAAAAENEAGYEQASDAVEHSEGRVEKALEAFEAAGYELDSGGGDAGEDRGA